MNNPAMRFKRDDGTVFPDWSSSEIGNVADTCSGGTPSTSVSEYWDGPIQWLTPTEINSKYVHNSKRTITSAGIASSSAKLLPIGALLLTTRATIGACSINNFDGDVSTNQGFQSLICKSSLFNEYAYYAITRDKFQKELIKHASGSTFLEISSKNLKKLPIPIPCLEEQQKIASFFSTLDQKIELNERKLEALEKLKKGVIQKIFSQKLRFKDKLGTPYPTWKTAPLGYEAFVFDGTHQTPKYTLDGIPFVSVEDINSLSSITKYISEEAYLTDFKASCRAKKGDIFMTRIGDIGTPSICPKDDIAYYVSLALIKCKNNLSNNFLKFAIESDKFQSELRKRSILTAFPKKINTGEIGKCLISLPCMDEQQKIASFFSALDQKIELNERKLEGLKKLKKGLMQQMFV